MIEGTVLDRRGEAQRESDDIRAGFDVYRRIREFIGAERFRDLGYGSAADWWQGERIGEHNQVAEADRKELVLALTGAGLSIRATGAMLSISPAQAQRDKTGKPSNKATTRAGRKASPHTTKTAGQNTHGGETMQRSRPAPQATQEPRGGGTASRRRAHRAAGDRTGPAEPPERELTGKQRELLLGLYDTGSADWVTASELGNADGISNIVNHLSGLIEKKDGGGIDWKAPLQVRLTEAGRQRCEQLRPPAPQPVPLADDEVREMLHAYYGDLSGGQDLANFAQEYLGGSRLYDEPWPVVVARCWPAEPVEIEVDGVVIGTLTFTPAGGAG